MPDQNDKNDLSNEPEVENQNDGRVDEDLIQGLEEMLSRARHGEIHSIAGVTICEGKESLYHGTFRFGDVARSSRGVLVSDLEVFKTRIVQEMLDETFVDEDGDGASLMEKNSPSNTVN